MPENACTVASAQARAEADIGLSLHKQGQFRDALARFEQAVRLDPSVGEYHYRLGLAAWRAGDAKFIEPHLLRAIELDPRHPAPHEALGQWLLEVGQIENAMQQCAAAVALRPDNPELVISYALTLIGDGQFARGAELLTPLIAQGSTSSRLAAAFAQCAPRIDREAEALSLIDRSLQKEKLSTANRAQLHFHAAALLDRLGSYDEAFERARLGNEGRKRSFDAAEFSRRTSRDIEFFTADRMKSLPRATHGNCRPVFIIGMPRSGSSLVEQILASHPNVFGAGELPAMTELAKSIINRKTEPPVVYPENLALLTKADLNRLAGAYLHRILSLNATAPCVTDKMLLNFRFLHLIELLMPQCKIIHCIRDPRDTCLSCFMTDFAVGNPFAFNLDHLASFYRDYSRLMRQWKKVLTLPILDVVYEEVVSDLQGQARRIVAFLGLEWNDSCLSFYENKRHVTTSSRDQVRQPIYIASVGRWKNYEKHLGSELLLSPVFKNQR